MHNSRKSKTLSYIKQENKIIKSINRCFIINNPEFKKAIKSFGFLKLCRNYYEIAKKRKNL